MRRNNILLFILVIMLVFATLTALEMQKQVSHY
jgi:hypothetical protein